MRAIFFDEDEARAAVARLAHDGYAASLERERLAGEDDDEGHPWAVLSDAPSVVLELLVDAYDGWLDEEDGPPAAGPAGGPAADRSGGAEPGVRPPRPPLDLPTAPRRVKRP